MKSIAVSYRVANNFTLTNAEFRVLIVLMAAATEKDITVPDIAFRADMDLASVRRALYGEGEATYRRRVKLAAAKGSPVPARNDTGGLVGLGAVKVEFRHGHASKYTVAGNDDWVTA